MRVLFLNLWHGKLQEPLSIFLDKQKNVDVFCFQEADRFDEENIFPDWLGEYSRVATAKQAGEKSSFSLITFVHPRFRILATEELLQGNEEEGLALAVQLDMTEGRGVGIVNIHGTARARVDGVWLESDAKQDFPARLNQSQIIIDFAKDQTVPIIFGGDFNVLPETKTIEMFRQAGYRDLIQEFRIQTTRNHYAWDCYPDGPMYFYSDYVLTHPEIKVKRFEVQSVEISDHLPLFLEIE